MDARTAGAGAGAADRCDRNPAPHQSLLPALPGAQQLVVLAVPEDGGKEEEAEELTGATGEGLAASPKQLPPVASPSKLPAMEIPGTLP